MPLYFIAEDPSRSSRKQRNPDTGEQNTKRADAFIARTNNNFWDFRLPLAEIIPLHHSLTLSDVTLSSRYYMGWDELFNRIITSYAQRKGSCQVFDMVFRSLLVVAEDDNYPRTSLDSAAAAYFTDKCDALATHRTIVTRWHQLLVNISRKLFTRAHELLCCTEPSLNGKVAGKVN
jgi:hypothetical protein